MRISGRVLLLLVAAAIAAFTAIVVRNHMSQPQAVETAPAPVVNRVLVAKHDLSPGSFVQGGEDLDWAPIPENIAKEESSPSPSGPEPAGSEPRETYLHEGMVKLSDFNGAVVRRVLRAGAPVPQSALMKSGEGGFMSAVIEPGKRAVSIAVNATSGNAGFISPGDHVDLIVTHRILKSSTDTIADEAWVSVTFVRDVRVVAVDQLLENPDNKAILAKTVTVEVMPRQAEQVAVAAEMGKISIALRSLTPQPTSPPADAQQTATEPAAVLAQPLSAAAKAMTDLYGNVKTDTVIKPVAQEENDYTRDSDVSQLLNHKNSVIKRVHVLHGDKSENLEF